MARSELSRADEERLVEQVMREQVGINPDLLQPITDLLALGMVNGAWRNTIVEHWHGQGRMHDGDMLRINSHTTMRVRQRVQGWLIETGLEADGSTSQLDAVSIDEVDQLASRVLGWLVNPRRKLPTGMTLAELAGEDLKTYEDEADRVLGTFAAQAEHRSVRYGFLRTAAHGGLACAHWWGHPKWPALVEEFVRALDDPAHPHWGKTGDWKLRLSPEPPAVQDREGLRRTLLNTPGELVPEAADWLVGEAQIGDIRHRVSA